MRVAFIVDRYAFLLWSHRFGKSNLQIKKKKKTLQDKNPGTFSLSILIPFPETTWFNPQRHCHLVPPYWWLNCYSMNFARPQNYRQTYVQTWSMIGPAGSPSPLFYQIDMRSQIVEQETWWTRTGAFSWCKKELRMQSTSQADIL